MLGKGGKEEVTLTVEEADTRDLDSEEEDEISLYEVAARAKGQVTKTTVVGSMALVQPGAQDKSAKEKSLELQRSLTATCEATQTETIFCKLQIPNTSAVKHFSSG